MHCKSVEWEQRVEEDHTSSLSHSDTPHTSRGRSTSTHVTVAELGALLHTLLIVDEEIGAGGEDVALFAADGDDGWLVGLHVSHKPLDQLRQRPAQKQQRIAMVPQVCASNNV